ncbi:MAG TPA: toprim domain-containing protein [Aquifex aeolicus]|nr:toprim domain-containing protein [Aquifex aeolicus]
MSQDFKDFKEWLKELKKESRGAIILVEGKNDKRALNKFSIENIPDLSGKRFSDIPDLLEGKWKKVVLLFDLDPHGERINQKIKELLSSQGFIVEEKFRNFLKKLNIIHIEDINGGENEKVKDS